MLLITTVKVLLGKQLQCSQLACLKIKLNCIQGRSVWIMELCAPCGKVLFVVCPSVRSKIGESASLSRSAHPVNDNPMERPMCGARPGWKRPARCLDEAQSAGTFRADEERGGINQCAGCRGFKITQRVYKASIRPSRFALTSERNPLGLLFSQSAQGSNTSVQRRSTSFLQCELQSNTFWPLSVTLEVPTRVLLIRSLSPIGSQPELWCSCIKSPEWSKRVNYSRADKERKAINGSMTEMEVTPLSADRTACSTFRAILSRSRSLAEG